MKKELRLILYNHQGARCLPDPGWIRINTDTQPQQLACDILESENAVMVELQDEDGHRLDVHIFDVDQLTWRFRGVPHPPASAVWKALATATVRAPNQLRFNDPCSAPAK